MTNPLAALRMTVAFTQIVRDPERLDVVFDLVDGLSGEPDAVAQIEKMLEDPQIGAAARARVRVPDLTLEGLEAMPAGSLGRVAAAFFRQNGLDPAALPRREAATDAEWLSAHLYESHDLWHVATGFGPDVPGELGLQAFYLAQIDGPVALAILTAGMLNTLIYAQEDARPRLAAVARGYQMGVRAKTFAGLDWGALLPRPLSEVRELLELDVPAAHDAMPTDAVPTDVMPTKASGAPVSRAA